MPADIGSFFSMTYPDMSPRLSVKLHPFATDDAFGFSVSPDAQAASVLSVLSSTLLPGFFGRELRHYYGIICHPAKHLALLESPLAGQYLSPELYRASPVNFRSL